MQGRNQSDIDFGDDVDDSIIVHKGKKYQKIQIEGLEADDNDDNQDYLMDEQGNIYNLDFQFVTNMDQNDVVVQSDNNDQQF